VVSNEVRGYVVYGEVGENNTGRWERIGDRGGRVVRKAKIKNAIKKSELETKKKTKGAKHLKRRQSEGKASKGKGTKKEKKRKKGGDNQSRGRRW